jgi:predicted HicB family RNase H-like nuclease
MMTYKGYTGVVKVDAEAGVLRGRVINTRDMITFQGRSVEEAKQAFRDSVDDYLEFCASRGEPPEKPYSGQLLLRLPPEFHSRLAVEAARRGVSLNTLVTRTLQKSLAKQRPTSKALAVSKPEASAKPKRTPAGVAATKRRPKSTVGR